MARILIEVKLATNKTYEFVLDDQADLREVLQKVISQIENMENGSIALHPDNVFLCDITTQQIIPVKGNVRSANIQSGHTLMIV